MQACQRHKYTRVAQRGPFFEGLCRDLDVARTVDCIGDVRRLTMVIPCDRGRRCTSMVQ
jgi:hypothetical protein